MNKEFIYRELLNILDEESIKVDEPMKKHITFRVGGPADFLVKPKTEAQLSAVLNFAKNDCAADCAECTANSCSASR